MFITCAATSCLSRATEWTASRSLGVRSCFAPSRGPNKKLEAGCRDLRYIEPTLSLIASIELAWRRSPSTLPDERSRARQSSADATLRFRMIRKQNVAAASALGWRARHVRGAIEARQAWVELGLLEDQASARRLEDARHQLELLGDARAMARNTSTRQSTPRSGPLRSPRARR